MSGAPHHSVDVLSFKLHNNVNPLGKVRLGNNVWIWTHAVIMSDVGSGAILAAGAVVTKPVAENLIVAGYLAKLVRFRG